MTTYFCVPRATADWLLSKPAVLDLVLEAIADDDTRRQLAAVEFAQGPIRLLASVDTTLVILWHVDYLSGTGDEDIGFIQLTEEFGLLCRPDICREVFERQLYVINQRLEGLFIDGNCIHRSHANGAHTCASGRGTDARQTNIGYCESSIATSAGAVKSLICVGPERDLVLVANKAAAAALKLPTLVQFANKQTDSTRHRQIAPATFLPQLREVLAAFFQVAPTGEYQQVSVATPPGILTNREIYRTAGWTYSDWVADSSPLSPVQRRLLASDPLSRHPIRIVGPGGSGKTLLMQLLAMRQLDMATQANRSIRILYLVHNSKMAEAVSTRFEQLASGNSSFADHLQSMTVTTLSDYARRELGLETLQVIDADAQEAKEYQAELIDGALNTAINKFPELVNTSSLLRHVRDNVTLQRIMVTLLMVEISTAIKGHGLTQDDRKYVQSERRLSRFHGALSHDERKFVFEVFRLYHNRVFEENGVLDSDDIALSLLGRLRAPIWELKRRTLGFDAVFVDETQLFNENERRIFPLLTKTTIPHLPIALALDEAQDLCGQTVAGMSSLGIEKLANESLSSIHRSTKSIIQLAFFVIQRSTDLFGPDFPDFTGAATQMEDDTRAPASPPRVEVATSTQSVAKAVVKSLRSVRSERLLRVGVVCYAERYWHSLIDELKISKVPLRVLEDRGERLGGNEQFVALSRPAHIGGQEFDAVILVGLEEGLVPPRVVDNDALAAAVEQQMLRELYLGLTRARFQVRIVIAHDATLTRVLLNAQNSGLLSHDN